MIQHLISLMRFQLHFGLNGILTVLLVWFLQEKEVVLLLAGMIFSYTIMGIMELIILVFTLMVKRTDP